MQYLLQIISIKSFYSTHFRRLRIKYLQKSEYVTKSFNFNKATIYSKVKKKVTKTWVKNTGNAYF